MIKRILNVRNFFSSKYLTIFYVEIIINNYGTGVVCGGSVLSYSDNIYRSYNGGISPLEDNLDINELGRIGNYNYDEVYHVEIINDNIWFALTNHSEMNQIKVVDSNGLELTSYEVGVNPGDFAFWSK